MRWLMILALSATPAAAECFSAEAGRLPARATYSDGTRYDYLSRRQGILEFQDDMARKAGAVWRTQHGIWALNTLATAGEVGFRLEGAVPDIAQIKAQGRAEVRGMAHPPAPAEPVPLRMVVEWLGSEYREIGGCTYYVDRLRREIFAGDTRVGEAEAWIEPRILVAFQVVHFAPDGRQTALELTGLE